MTLFATDTIIILKLLRKALAFGNGCSHYQYIALTVSCTICILTSVKDFTVCIHNWLKCHFFFLGCYQLHCIQIF
jgi:hypothetical protein